MTIQDTPTVPLTLLQAINEMLAAVGRTAVSSTDPSQAGTEAAKAIAIIQDVAVQVQSQGWRFNEEIEYPLQPSPVDGTLSVPLNTLVVKRNRQHLPRNYRPPGDRDRSFTLRGNPGNNGQLQLWDLANQTFSWALNTDGFAVVQPLVTGTLLVDLYLAFPFEEIPQAIRWLILAKAARMFAVGRVPDMNTFRFSDTVYQDALAAAEQFDQDDRTTEAEDSPHFAMMRRR